MATFVIDAINTIITCSYDYTWCGLPEDDYWCTIEANGLKEPINYNAVRVLIGSEAFNKLCAAAEDEYYISEFGMGKEAYLNYEDKEYRKERARANEEINYPQERIRDSKEAARKSMISYAKEAHKYFDGCFSNNAYGRKAEAKRNGIKKLNKLPRIREARRSKQAYRQQLIDSHNSEQELFNLPYDIMIMA